MEIYQLKTFIEITNTGNLTKAATKLNLSQPAASAHIKALEEEVGFSLFNRVPKGMIITEKGKQLLENAKKIVSLYEGFNNKVDEINSIKVDKIKIGLNTNGDILRISDMLNLMFEKNSKLEFHFIKTRSEDFMHDIKSSKIDAGFYYGEIQDSKIENITLNSYRLVVVYPYNWSLEEITLENLREKSWIWTTKGCPFYKKAISYFKEKNLDLNKIIYVDDEVLVGKLVSEEVGCSILSEPIAKQFEKEKKVKILKIIDDSINLNFGYSKESSKISILNEVCMLLSQIWKKSSKI